MIESFTAPALAAESEFLTATALAKTMERLEKARGLTR
jgi:hypothetical protein